HTRPGSASREPVDGRYSIVRYSSLAPSTSRAERCLALLDPRRDIVRRAAMRNVGCRASPYRQPKISPQGVQRTVIGAGDVVTDRDQWRWARRTISAVLLRWWLVGDQRLRGADLVALSAQDRGCAALPACSVN